MTTTEKKINKQATIQKIFDWANAALGRSVDRDGLNKLMEQKNWEKELKEIAAFCKTEIVYE